MGVASCPRFVSATASARAPSLQTFGRSANLAHNGMQLEITRWSQQTGVQFVSLINAAQLASCCGASLQLPSKYIFGPASSTSFTFSSASNASFCQSASGNSDKFFYKSIPVQCRTLYHRSRAYHLAKQYAELPSKCGGVTTGTVAHVRTLDMNPSQAVHPAYGQPPLSFYLSAWNHTGDNTLHVVHKDLSSPVAKTLDVLRRSTNMPIKMHSHDRFKHDLLILLCAKNLIMSRSSLNFIVLMNPRLRRMYHYEKPSDGPWRLISYSCRTAHFHAQGRTSRWLATASQKLDLVVTDPPVEFERAKTTCLEPRGQLV